ncbi:MAG: dihydropteroate synthase [Acidobacteria bacterium]|nr:MAG: dihydropteroate synthase [Acidobacteriota bacterium]
MKWICHSKTIDLSKRPLIMGIVNVTPDSFSGGIDSPQEAIQLAQRQLEEGADLLDIGGESTRPGSDSISVQQELDRVMPIIQALKNLTDRPLSIDTQKEAVAREAIGAGADIINHVSGSLDYGKMLSLLQENQAGYIGMHMKARPKTMQEQTGYGNVTEEVCASLLEIKNAFVQNGIQKERLIFDPGIGFGKTPEQCILLMTHLKKMASQLDCPILMGLSRKSWMKHYFNLDVSERDPLTATASALLPFPEVAIHRVHDVGKTRNSLFLKGLLENREWEWD